MADIFCKDCDKYTAIVFDHTSGYTFCSECGRFLQSQSTKISSKCCTFPDSAINMGPTRVRSINPLITKTAKTTTNSTMLSLDNKSRQHLSAFEIISNMAAHLSLVSTVKDRANEIYKNLNGNYHHYRRGRNPETILAACLLIACQQEKLPHTLKEMYSVTDATKTSKQNIGRAKTFITQYLKNIDINNANTNPNNNSITNNRVAHSSDYVKRFCFNAGIMDEHAMKAAFEAAVKLEEMDVRRSPSSLAAAVVYIVSKLYEKTRERIGCKNISVVTGVAQSTIKNSCRDIMPHVEKIIPKWFASGDDFKVLRSI